MNDFKVMNDRIRKPYIKVVAIIFGISLFGIGILLGSIFGIIIGPILIWAAIFVKFTNVSEEGIVVNYDAKIFKYQEEWLFDEVTNIHREDLKDPQYTRLHFTKGAMSKALVFSKKDAKKILKLAQTKNNTIFIEDAH